MSYEMLSFDEELELSDRLVARRAVLDSCVVEDREPSSEEQEIVEDGDRAAAELVQAYSPYIYNCANIVYRKCAVNGVAPTGISVEDIAQEGFDAAMRCTNRFNTRRDEDGTWKLRFARYSSMAIFKAMNRYLLKMSTPYRVDVELVQISNAFMKAEREIIEEEGGRYRPTEEEVAERAGINLGKIKGKRLDLLPYRSQMQDIDDPETHRTDRAPLVEVMNDYDTHYAGILSTLIKQTFTQEETQVILESFLGLDRGYARDADEVFEDIGQSSGISKRRINKVVSVTQHALIHPRYRVKMSNSLREGFPDVFEELNYPEEA